MTTHPLLTSLDKLAPLVAARADEIESNRRVPGDIISALSEAGFFRLAVPREYGGDEVDPLIVFDALEALAKADASTAWVTMIISANPMLMGNAIGHDVWQALYGADPDMRSAGTIAPNGRAVAVDGGYQVSGRWKYGSGCEHCEYLISGCMVFENERPVMGLDGAPQLLWVIHPVNDCTIHTDTWDTTGLRGSGSHDYEVADLFIPAEWSFIIGDSRSALENPMYRFATLPFSQLAGIGLGLARRAIDIILEISPQKRRGPMLMSEDPSIQNQVAHAEAMVTAGRLYVRHAVATLMDQLNSGAEPDARTRATFRLACTYALENAVAVVDNMYKLGGGNAIYRQNPLERIFRDIHTAATHIQFNDLTWVKAGRLLLGVDPRDPLF